MAEKIAAKAPYSFVPYNPQVLIRYESMSEMPRHDILEDKLKTGEIHVTMTAQTPVFVSNGKKDQASDLHFYRAPSGKYAIPGSTIRGMVRSNMKILGFGLVRPGEDLEDRQIYYRKIAARGGSAAKELNNHYKNVLDIETRKCVSIPHNVQAGYLRKRGNEYEICPIKGVVLRVNRKHPDVQFFGVGHARTIQVSYTALGDKVKRIYRRNKAIPDTQNGTLLYTGRPVGGNTNPIYLFPQADPNARPIPVTEDDVLSYKLDLEARSNSLKAYYDVKFWGLPKAGEEKPVFYIRHDGHIYFGMTRFPRIGYRHVLSDGLPQQHKEILTQGKLCLDYPYAILGFATAKEAYRSRVSFGDFEALDQPKEILPVRVILGNPNPSYFPGYTIDGKHYNQEFALHGRKRYWLKKAAPERLKKDNVAATLKPLAEGTIFKGVIRFKNLHEDELGLLLWSLLLEEGCFQSIGLGKPYGYGRMKLKITDLYTMDFNRLYDTEYFCDSSMNRENPSVYIEHYDAYATEKLSIKNDKVKPSVRNLNAVKDFFYICRTIREPAEVCYMELKEYTNSSVLPSIAMVRTKQNE